LVSQAAELIRDSFKRIREAEEPVDEILLEDFIEFIGTLQAMLNSVKRGDPQDLEEYPWLMSRLGKQRAGESDTPGMEEGSGWRVQIISSGTGLTDEIRESLIRSGIQVQVSANTVAVMVEIRKFRPDVIILDIEKSEMNQKEMCEVIRLDTRYDATPILVVTDHGEELATETEDLCKITAILPRRIHWQELLTKVGAYLSHSKIFRSLEQHDPMTGLYNYRFFHERSIQVLESSRQTRTPMTIALIEVTDYESANNYHGYFREYLPMRLVAQLFLDNLRQSDIVARYSGGRLGIIMAETKPSDAHRVLTRLKIRGTKEYAIQSGIPENGDHPSFIAGIAGYPDHGDHVGGLVQKAEGALHDAVLTDGIVVTDR
jgi:diguanylate cyclase (GGDEF)-like protein